MLRVFAALFVGLALLLPVRNSVRVEGLHAMDAPLPAVWQSEEWHLGFIGIPVAWRYTTGQGATVCVLDTGADATDTDLKSAIVAGTNTINPKAPTDWSDGVGHGTFVAGEIAGRGNLVLGAAPQAKVLVAKVLDDTGAGEGFNVGSGMAWCIQHGANVMSLSLGGPISPYDSLGYWTKLACQRGIAVSVAAGNDGGSNPGDLSGINRACVIVSNAVDSKGILGPFSDFNVNHREISAPGVDVLGDLPGDHVGVLSGTSMATPLTSAVLALLMSQGATAQQAVAIALKTARPAHHGSTSKLLYGAGYLDAGAATMLCAKVCHPKFDRHD